MPTTRKSNEPVIAVAIATLALLASLAAGAQVYRWTDEQGRAQYGDKPPEGVKTKEIKITAKSYDGPPQIDDWAAIIRRPTPGTSRSFEPSGGPRQLTMYSATWCGPCKRAKAHLAKTGTGYRDVDIDASDSNKEEFRSYGGGGVPLFILGKRRMRGFSPEALDELLAKGTPR